MASVLTVSSFASDLLRHSEIQDASQNGLQICPDESRPVRRICSAVDSGLAVLEAAAKRKADLLLVHHGLLWGKSLPIAGNYGEKVRLCMKRGLSLFASHLPLDTHLTLGNSAQLAGHFQLARPQQAFFHGKTPIGVVGELPSAAGVDASHFVSRAQKLVGSPVVRLLPFGPKRIRRVGIVSGGTSTLFDYPEISQVDLLITGEPRQSNYHDAREAQVNLLYVGHYASETVGVRALGELLRKRFRVAHEFIDIPTGI